MSAAAGLGQASRAVELVPGDPGGVRRGAGMLRDFGVELGEAADVVAAAQAREWTGAAAKVFKAARAEQPKRLRDAADAFARAASALSFYAEVLEDARGDAARALGLWADGEHATAVWRAQQARAQAAGVRVAGGGGWDVAAASREDPGLGDRQRAQRMLASARDSLAYEAGVAARALDDAAAQAPSKPGWLAGAWHHVTHGAGEVWHGAEHVGEDVWHGAKDVGEFVVHHPGEIVKALEDAGEMVAGALAVAVGEAAIDAGVVLSVTGVGAVAGVPLAAEGVALAGLGIGAGVQGAERLTKDINQMRAEANTDASGGEAATEGKAPLDEVTNARTQEAMQKAEATRLVQATSPTVEDVKALVPEGETLNTWGQQIWGTGAAGADSLIGTRSAAELERIGLTKQNATTLRNFYRAAVAAEKGGDTAPVRVRLLNNIIETLGGTP